MVGAQFVSDAAPYEDDELRLLNRSHLAVTTLAAEARPRSEWIVRRSVKQLFGPVGGDRRLVGPSKGGSQTLTSLVYAGPWVYAEELKF
jgi:hypothetical protein